MRKKEEIAKEIADTAKLLAALKKTRERIGMPHELVINASGIAHEKKRLDDLKAELAALAPKKTTKTPAKAEKPKAKAKKRTPKK